MSKNKKVMAIFILSIWLFEMICIMVMLNKPYEPMPQQIGFTQSF